MDEIEIFAVGTIWFFLLVIPVLFWLFACVESEHSFWATITVVGTLFILQFLGGVEVFTGIYENPGWFLFGVAGYIAIALNWSVGKWVFFARKKRHEYDQAMARFHEHYPNTSVVGEQYLNLRGANLSSEQLEEAKQQFIEAKRPRSEDFKPNAMREKDRILVWAMFWPWSMLWTIVNDPVREFFEWLIAEFQGVYQRISDWAFKGVDDNPIG